MVQDMEGDHESEGGGVAKEFEWVGWPFEQYRLGPLTFYIP